jgi:hypothetical protein
LASTVSSPCSCARTHAPQEDTHVSIQYACSSHCYVCHQLCVMLLKQVVLCLWLTLAPLQHPHGDMSSCV